MDVRAGLFSYDANAVTRREADDSGGGGEEGVVAGALYVASGLEAGAALPDDYGSGFDGLAAVAPDAPMLGGAVASVSRGPLSLFVCHF